MSLYPTPANPIPHEYGPSRVGHGEGQCIHCFGTNRENAVISPNHCEQRAMTMTSDLMPPDSREKLARLAEREVELVVVGRRCVYLNDHRIAGGKPYVSENLPQHSFKLKVGEILSALPELAAALRTQPLSEPPHE